MSFFASLAKHKAVIGLVLTLASAALGVACYAYLGAELSVSARQSLTAVWLLGALLGFVLSLRATLVGPREVLGGVGWILSFPNVQFALLFAMGAAMGG